MFFDASGPVPEGDPTRLTLEDLIAVEPRHIRGHQDAGNHGPNGERPGRGRSSTLDFDGLSPYVTGDDVRAIDWRASMRSDQTVVRRFAAASHRAHMLIVDLRSDLYFGTSDRIMAKTVCLATAWLAWKAVALHEPVGLSVGAFSFTPRRGRKHVLRMLDVLVKSYSAGGSARVGAKEFAAAAEVVGHRDEICLITDMPSDPEPLQEFGKLMSRSRILRMILVEDPFTTKPARSGRYPVRDTDGRRQVIRITGGSIETPNQEAKLKDAGWVIDRALDLLPRRGSQ